jgi:hypothetical protein
MMDVMFEMPAVEDNVLRITLDYAKEKVEKGTFN